jgi:PAS domain S-box-containing protein
MSESQASSSRASTGISTGSTSSSQAITVAEAVAQHLLPAINSLDKPLPTPLCAAGLLAEHLQTLALLISSVWPWSSTMRGLGVALYFTLLPFWDRRYEPGVHVHTFNEFQAYFWTAVGLIGLTTAIFAFHAHGLSTRSLSGVTTATQLAVASLGSWLFLPLLHVLLAGMVCDANTAPPAPAKRGLAAFPEQECYAGAAIATFILGVICFVLLCLARYVVMCLMIPDSPSSVALRARPHSGLDTSVLLVHCLVGVLYHVMLPVGLHQAFAAIVAVLYTGLAAYVVANLPYLAQWLNRATVAFYLTVAVTATQIAIMYSAEEERIVTTTTAADQRVAMYSPYDALIWFAACVVVSVCGLWMAEFRVSASFKVALASAVEGIATDTDPQYPSGLPMEERTKIVEVENYLFAQKRQSAMQAEAARQKPSNAFGESKEDHETALAYDRQDLRDQVAVLQPYVSAVHQATDVELAGRFMRHYEANVRNRPSFSMVIFGLRICSKGLARFPTSVYLNLHLAYYIACYIPSRAQDVAAILLQFQRDTLIDIGSGVMDTLDLGLHYRVARRSAEISGSALLRDTSQKRFFAAAQRLHRDALQHMSQFWGHLLDDHTDVSQLSSLAKTITDKREEGVVNFQRVCHERSDQPVLARYAQFLEQVMLDAEGADLIRDYIVDVVEQQELNRGGDMVARGIQHLVDRQATTTATQSVNLSVLRAVLVCLFLLAALLITGFIVFGAVFSSQTQRLLDRAQVAGIVRDQAHEAAVLVEQLAFALQSPSLITSDTGYGRLVSNASVVQASILALSASFRSSHFDLTVGEHAKDDGSDMARLNIVATRELYDGTTTVTATTASLWTLGSLLASTLEQLGHAAITTSDGVTEVVSGVQLVRANAIGPIGKAVNESVRLIGEEAARHATSAHYVLTALAVASLLACAATYTVLIFNFRAINATKLSTLSLFTLIPKTTVSRLRQQTSSMLERFDAPDVALEEKLLAKGVATEQQERRSLMQSQRAQSIAAGTDATGSEQGPAAVAAAKRATDRAAHVAAAAFSNLKGENAKRADGKILRARSAARRAEKAVDTADSAAILEDNSLFEFEPMMDTLERTVIGKVVAETAESARRGDGADVDVIDFQAADSKERNAASEATAADDIALVASSRIFLVCGIIAVLVVVSTACVGASGGIFAAQVSAAQRANDGLQALQTAAVNRQRAVDAAMAFVARPAAIDRLVDYLELSEAPATQGAGLGSYFATDAGTLSAVYAANAAWMSLRRIMQITMTLSCTAASDATLRLASAVNPPQPIAPPLQRQWIMTQQLAGNSTTNVTIHADTVPRCVASGDDFIAQARWTDVDAPAAYLTALRELLTAGMNTTTQLRSSDAARVNATSETLIMGAVGVLASRAIDDLRRASVDQLGDAARGISNAIVSDTHSRHTAVTTLAGISIAAASIVVLALLLSVTLGARLSAVRTWRNVFLTVCIFALVVVAIPAGSVLISATSQHSDEVERLQAVLRDRNASSSVSLGNRRLLFRATLGGSAAAAREFDENDLRRSAENALIELSQHVESSRVLQISDGLSSLQRWTFVARVAQSITDDWTLPTTASIAARWNFTAELLAATTALDYPEQVFYSNTAADRTLPLAQRRTLAWGLTAGPLADDLAQSVQRAIDDVARAGITLSTKAMEDVSRTGTTWAIAGAVCGLLAVLSVALVAQSIALGLTRDRDGHNVGSVTSAITGDEGNAAAVSQTRDALFDSLRLRSRIAVIILVAAVCVVYIVGEALLTRDRTDVIDAASQRQSVLWRQLASLQVAPAASLAGRTELAATVVEGDRATRVLYFGADDESVRYNVLGRWANVDEDLFGSPRATEDALTCGVSAASSDVEATVIGGSVDLAMRRWRTRVAAAAATVYNATEFALQVAALQADSSTAIEQLRQSTKLIYDASRDNTRSFEIAFLIIAAIALLVVAAVFVMVLRPMLAELSHEEEGTKLMLKMIPEDVRQSVPAIAEYLRRGVVLQDTKIQSINEAMTEMSTLPTIVIDFQGRILRFSRAAEETFGYAKDEVLGKNVKILMPASYAAEHDNYLDAYYRTGVKHAIGTSRRVRGQRKDGSVFPIEINVKEIKTGSSTTFVGTLRDVAVDVEFERTTALSKAMSEVAPLPIIVINDVGIVQRFNRAAEKLFDFAEIEIVGHNVTRLMTDVDAEKHDFFLERYKRTGVGKVIGKRRAVRCRRRTGAVFIGLLSVVELRQDNGTVFIGYCSDCTERLETDVATVLGDAISMTAPIPLVTINAQGIVETWNPAAARVFRTPATEIIGRNIKQIMPEAVASKHDGYLNTYLRTGKKSMLDSTTSAKARRPSTNSTGYETFPVTISATELTSASGQKSYVAYLRDEGRVSELALASRIAEAIREMSIVPIIIISVTGIVKAFSRAAQELFGYSPDEVVGRNVKMLMPPEIAQLHDRYLKAYQETGNRHVIGSTRRLEGRHKDGSPVYVELTLRETQFQGDISFIGFVRSVESDVKRTQENAINAAVTRLSVLPVLAIDMSGKILSCSDSTCRKFDWPREELIGQNIKVLMPDQYALKHDGYLSRYADRLAEKGSPEQARLTSTILHRTRRVTAKTRDDDVFEAELSVRDLHIEGLPPVFVGSIRDITEDMEKAERTAYAETIIESSSIPFIAIDRLGTVSVFSCAAEAAFGYAKAEVLGHNVKMLMPEEIAFQHDGYLRAYAKTGIKRVIDQSRQVKGKAKDGTIFDIEINIREMTHTDQTGKTFSEFVGFVRSLKQERILEQAAKINKVTAELVSTPVVMIDELGTIIDFNPAAAQVFGYAAEQAKGLNVKVLMPPEVAVKHDGYLAAYKATGVKHIIDATSILTAMKKDGSQFPAELSIREVNIAGRQEKQFVGYIRDLTQQQKVEELATVNAAIIDVAPTALIVIDRIGTISVFSRAAELTFGWTAAEVIGKNVKLIMPEETASQHDFYLRRYAETGVKRVVDTQRNVIGQRKNGGKFPARITLVEIEVNGEVNYVGYVADETERNRADDEGQMAEFFATTSTVPVISIDHMGTIVTFSPAAEQLFQFTKAEVVGRNIKMLQPASIAAHHDGYLSNYLKTGVRHVIGVTRQVTARRRDGKEFPANIRVTELRADPAQPPTYIGYVWSIEDELRTQQASVESNTLLRESPTPIIVITQAGIVVEANPTALRAFGIAAKDDLLGKNVKVLMDDATAAQHDGFLERYRVTQEAHVIGSSRRVMGKRMDGSMFPLQLSVREVKIQGLDTQYIGALTLLEEHEKNAAESELSSAIRDLSTNGVIIMDPKGTVLRFSRAAERITGYTAKEVVGNNVKMLMPPQIAERHDDFLAQYARTGVRHIVGNVRRVQGQHKTGRVYSAEISVEEVELSTGKVFAGFLQSFEGSTNVTMSSEINTVMMTLAVHTIILMSENGIVEDINQAGLQLFGLRTADDIIGHNIKELMTADVGERHDDFLRAYRETGVKSVVDSSRRTTARNVRTGQTIHIDIAVRELPAIGTRPRRFMGYVRDASGDMKVDVAVRTGQAMMDLSKYSVVVIDAAGIIVKFSRAAEELWRCKSGQVIGRNVKMLMPDRIGVHHDGYLSAYRRTGKKTVIDRVKDVMAKRVGGQQDEFPVTLQVKEMKFDAKGLENVYVAFIEASTNDTAPGAKKAAETVGRN